MFYVGPRPEPTGHRGQQALSYHFQQFNISRRWDPQVLGRITAFGEAAQDPADFPTSPVLAARKALEHAGLRPCDVDFWEVNQAFSVVDLVNQKLLDIRPEKCAVPY